MRWRKRHPHSSYPDHRVFVGGGVVCLRASVVYVHCTRSSNSFISVNSSGDFGDARACINCCWIGGAGAEGIEGAGRRKLGDMIGYCPGANGGGKGSMMPFLPHGRVLSWIGGGWSPCPTFEALVSALCIYLHVLCLALQSPSLFSFRLLPAPFVCSFEPGFFLFGTLSGNQYKTIIWGPCIVSLLIRHWSQGCSPLIASGYLYVPWIWCYWTCPDGMTLRSTFQSLVSYVETLTALNIIVFKYDQYLSKFPAPLGTKREEIHPLFNSTVKQNFGFFRSLSNQCQGCVPSIWLVSPPYLRTPRVQIRG